MRATSFTRSASESSHALSSAPSPASSWWRCATPTSAVAPRASTALWSRQCRDASSATRWTTCSAPTPMSSSPPTPAVRCSSRPASAPADQRCGSSTYQSLSRGPTSGRKSALESRQRGRLGHIDLDASHGHGHVVRGSKLATARDDTLGAAIDVPIPEQDPSHLFDAHPCALDAVAAQDDRIAFLELHPVGERLDRVPNTDGTREPGLKRMGGGILRFDHAQPHLFRRPRMIL